MKSRKITFSSIRGKAKNILLVTTRNRTTKYSFMVLLFLMVGYCAYSISKRAYILLVVNDPTKWYEVEDTPSGELQSLKTEIINELNKEISQDKKQKVYEKFRILAVLRSFFRNIPGQGRKGTSEQAHVNDEANRKIPASSQSAKQTESFQTTNKPHDIQLRPTINAKDFEKSSVATTEHFLSRDAKQASAGTLPLQQDGMADIETNQRWQERIRPLEGIHTKGIAWRINRRMMLEGIFDASSIGQTDRELQDFGIRSMHALTLLRQASKPEFLIGQQKIDSGFPRSYGIGINFQLSPSTNLIFDYIREFPDDYYIEYTGSWESSLVADYLRWRPDTTNATHSFFFGMRYLHRQADYVVPIHTGFFYSTTTMAETPLQPEVSLGFSLGTGLYVKGITLGVAYRMRIYETPNELLLMEHNPELSRKITNQLLFQANF